MKKKEKFGKEKFSKQFSLAKLLKENGKGLTRLKYLNPSKIILESIVNLMQKEKEERTFGKVG